MHLCPLQQVSSTQFRVLPRHPSLFCSILCFLLFSLWLARLEIYANDFHLGYWQKASTGWLKHLHYAFVSCPCQAKGLNKIRGSFGKLRTFCHTKIFIDNRKETEYAGFITHIHLLLHIVTLDINP